MLTPRTEELVEMIAGDDTDHTPPEGIPAMDAAGVELVRYLGERPAPADRPRPFARAKTPDPKPQPRVTEPQLRRARDRAAEGRADRFINTFFGLRAIANRRGIPLHEAFAIALQGSRDKPKRVGIGARGLRREGDDANRP